MPSDSRRSGILAAILIASSAFTLPAAHADSASRQAPPRYLSDPDTGPQWGYWVGQRVEDQRVYLRDPAFDDRRRVLHESDDVNWRLRKLFEERVGAGDEK